MRWLRTFLIDDEYENSNWTLDLLVDDNDRIVERVPFCGWWGKIGSTDVLPVTILADGKVDTGSGEDTNQKERFGFAELAGRRVTHGEVFSFEMWGDLHDARVESFRDLTQGV